MPDRRSFWLITWYPIACKNVSRSESMSNRMSEFVTDRMSELMSDRT